MSCVTHSSSNSNKTSYLWTCCSRHTPEEDIELLGFLSEPLRVGILSQPAAAIHWTTEKPPQLDGPRSGGASLWNHHASAKVMHLLVEHPLTGSCRYEIHVGSSGIAEGFFCWPGSMAFSRWLIRRSESFMKKSAKKTQNVRYFFSESQNDEVTLCETKHTNKVSTTLEGGSCLC